MQRTNPSSTTASPAASSPRDLPTGGLCAIHQPNFLSRLTTPAKLFAANAQTAYASTSLDVKRAHAAEPKTPAYKP